MRRAGSHGGLPNVGYDRPRRPDVSGRVVNFYKPQTQRTMGTYTELTVAGYPLISSKSEVIPEVMMAFREGDRRVFTRRLSERNPLVWGDPEEGDNQQTETAIEYTCETRKVVERLGVMGFGMRRARQEFEAGRQFELEKFRSWADDKDSLWFAEEWDFIKTFTFDQYVKALEAVITNGLRPLPFRDRETPGLDVAIKYILDDHDNYLLGFLGGDPRLLLRIACELVRPDTFVVQDITDLVNGGYYGNDEAVCENVTRELTAGHPENSPQIILTEGATDGMILKEALSLLYPHLAGYYSFLDFDSTRSPGGAGYLVSVIKAFAGAGITNRIIALFDNDTAAHEATRALASVALPPNITLRHYPELDLLRKYPTLGPNGLAPLNVNGLAASIELYLGEDLLLNGGRELTPVQWKGYSQTLGQYQGEVLKKNTLHEAFQRRVAACRADPGLLKATDWSGLSAILQMIFRAFD